MIGGVRHRLLAESTGITRLGLLFNVAGRWYVYLIAANEGGELRGDYSQR